MKIAFIVQRYGTEILGGSEYHCRLIAERLSSRHAVEVLTTCARDYITWSNEYTEGTDRVRGVTVRRFENECARDIVAFNRYSDWIFNHPHTENDEFEWLKQQGPWCPKLLEFLQKNHESYDALIFFTYLYAPTVLGLKINPKRSILVPTAHDEPAIHLSLYRDVFKLPAGIAYNTEVERKFLKTNFSIEAINEEVVGCGVNVPLHYLTPTVHSSGPEDTSAETNLLKETTNHSSSGPRRSRINNRGETFKRKHRLHGPIALYGGRIDPGKGCEELFEYYSTYANNGGEATLVLMGVKLMPLPEEPFVRFAGLLSERERLQALEAATLVLVPSPLESLSLLALESFAVGTPILVNARSDVLVEHCRRSNAGLYYSDRDEFVECMKLLMADKKLRTAMGRNGQSYIQQLYRWDVILDKYERMIERTQEPFKNTSPTA